MEQPDNPISFGRGLHFVCVPEKISMFGREIGGTKMIFRVYEETERTLQEYSKRGSNDYMQHIIGL